MRYHAFACDYDGTLAHEGAVGDELVMALRRLRDSGRKLILVTGRELDDLCRDFPHVDLFDRVVSENGALLYCPATRQERVLAEHPNEALIHELEKREVTPLHVGRVIVSTWHPYETAVLEAIQSLGLEHQVIFNKGAVMVLPPGVNKASGLQAALAELNLSPHNVVGVGDAENDHAFLRLCECSAAVANALPSLKEQVDLVTGGDHGNGVAELIDRILEDDLRDLEPRLSRHAIPLGTRQDGEEVRLPAYGSNVLIAGTSGGGKSTLTTGLLERLEKRQYQFCLIDPEGDYESLAGAVVFGSPQRCPTEDEVLQLLQMPSDNAVVNLLAVPPEDRLDYFARLLLRIEELRTQTGRPHWIILDEAHQLLPSKGDAATILPEDVANMVLLTVHPEHVAPEALAHVDVVVAVGEGPGETLAAFARAVGEEPPTVEIDDLEAGRALVWDRRSWGGSEVITVLPPQTDRLRHRRKYATGELAPEKSFYFRGPEGKLNLRAQNLMLFIQLAEGVDEATWMHHLRCGDYSRWFREMIGDEELAEAAVRVESQEDLSAEDSRAQIRDLVEERYTAPA